VLILATLVVFGLVFALVTWRRRATGRWRPDAAREVVKPGVPWCTTVWMQKEVPSRSRRGGNERVRGELCVDAVARAATFRASDGQEVRITDIRSITAGPAGTDFVNTWVEARGALNGRPVVVYLNDARWLGWRPVLTNANARLADALFQIRVAEPPRP